MAQEVSDFLKGQDDKIIDDLKGKMADAAQTMEFERSGIPWSNSGHWNASEPSNGRG